MSDISDRRTDLPPRAIGVPDTGQGLFQKFEVRRTDGSSEPGGKHEGCEYFVLDTDHDAYAEVALAAYANACEATHPLLARDLRQRHHLPENEHVVRVPIGINFDAERSVGWVQIHREALPPTPDWCIAIAYSVTDAIKSPSGRTEITGYRLLGASITSDSDYERVIDREKGRRLTEPTEQVVQALRERAIGIARDIADVFATERNDGDSSAALFRHLADHLLAEPELVRTIAAWHAAALHQVDGGKPHAAQPEAVAWRPIETAPQDGYLMCYEDGAYRLKLRHEGKWLDTAYAGIECAPWGDVAVGADAQRILDMRADAGRYKLVVRDGCCENPTHWMPLPEPPGLAAPPTEPQAAQQPEAYVFAGWQQRYIDPEEGPSSWQACQDSDVRLLQGRKDYELRKVYAATPPTEPAPALLVRDVAEMLCMDSSVPVCKTLVALGYPPRSTNMAVTPAEAVAVAKHLAAPAPEPSAQAVREPGDPLHDDAYVRGVAVGFAEDDSRRTTLLRIADRMQKLAAAPQPAPSAQAVAHPSHQTVREWMPVSEALRLSDLWTAGDLDNCGQWRAAIKVLADEVRALAAAQVTGDRTLTPGCHTPEGCRENGCLGWCDEHRPEAGPDSKTPNVEAQVPSPAR